MKHVYPELSVIIPALIDRREDISAYQELDTDRSDIEVIVRRDDGIPTARNRGIANANSDKIVFLVDDAIPENGFIDAAIRSLEEYEIVAGRVLNQMEKLLLGVAYLTKVPGKINWFASRL